MLLPVRLWPAGVLLSAANLTTRAGTATPVTLTYHPIDPATQAPGPEQKWRCGTPAPSVQVQVDNPAVAARPATPGTGGFSVEALQPGAAVFTLVQPPGLVAARVLQRLAVTVLPGLTGVQSFVLGANLQARISFLAAPRNTTATLSSTQPDKLVFSTDPHTRGTPVLNVAFTPGQPPTVYAQSLGGKGLVWVTVRAPGFADERFSVHIVPSSWRWFTTSRVSLQPNQQDYRATAFLAILPPPGLLDQTASNAIPRPDLGPLELTVEVEDPTKARLKEATLAIGPQTTSLAFSLSAVSPGTTRVLLRAPAPFAAPGVAGELTVTVQGAPPPPPVPLRLVPVTPCHVADTRVGEGKTGAFGPPLLQAGETGTLPIPAGACGIPAAAQAYSLNITVVPAGPLPYLTVWPAGTPQPLVSTLNAFDGRVTANAAIVPAGPDGAISFFAADRTDVMVDINGHFVP